MSKYDSLLKQTQVFEKIAVYGSRKDFLTAVAQAAASPMPASSSQPGGENGPVIPFESLVPYKDPTAPAAKPAKQIDSALLQAQKDLNTLGVLGMSGPLKPDGIMGPETHYALNQYRIKNRLRMPPNMSNALLYVMIHRDVTGQNNHVNLEGLHQTTEHGPVPQEKIDPGPISPLPTVRTRASRIDQLKKLAQNLSSGAVAFPGENIASALSSVSGSAANLARLLEGSQLDFELDMSKKISTMLGNASVSSFVNDKSELDAKASPIFALLGNAINVGSRAESNSPNPQARSMGTQLKNEAQRAVTLINSFYRNNGISFVDIESTLSPHNPPVAGPAPTAAPAKPKASVADAAKNLAKALEARVDRLSTGPQRAAQLKELEAGVKALQNYFRHLQKAGGLQGYFARMEIVSALQKIYSALEYADLDVVQSLNAGRGVPETPDSKI